MEIAFSFIPLLLLAGLVAAIVAGFRSMSSNSVEEGEVPIDAAEAAKSFAIHVGLFLALLASVWGLIDVFQSFVEGDRIAGTSSELARGLSLLIVGLPVFAFLVRVIDRRYRDRAELGDIAPHRGWTVYLVATLTTSLVASLVSVGQITDRLTTDGNEFRPEELVQLIVWGGVWAAHWFGLRPRYRARGDAHLALGVIVGLAWLISGVGAVVYRLLDRAYRAAFDDPLTDDVSVTFWIVVALVGAVVWAWHWLGHLNAAASVEGDRRRSALWFFTVIVAGVLPGLIAMLVAATSMISGVLIWFVGSTNQDAVDFFRAAPTLITVLLLGFITWGYHRWEIERSGQLERNEALRFHDYVVLSTALLGVVTAVAILIGQFFEAVSTTSRIAGASEVGNTLIVAITVLIASVGVWWAQWSVVEGHRVRHPVEESNSIWRKLYLITAFGVGGVILSVSAIWVLFVLLRELLDRQTSHDTFGDLEGPVGWGLAVLGAVWYHLEVWRADRALLGAQATRAGSRSSSAAAPPPPSRDATPASLPSSAQETSGTISVRAARPADAGEVFTLMRAAAAEEALRTGSLDVPELRESLIDVEARVASGDVLVAVDKARIVGAASSGRGAHIAPDRQGQGVEDLLAR